MLRNLPPLNALRAFEAAGRHESFSRAADELGVSHSSISRHVRGLEDRLGVQLFRDLPRGLALSPEGASYLEQVTPALDAIGQATEGLSAVPRGTVTVNVETLFALKWLVPRLGIFREAHPDVDIRVEASSRLADVLRYEADFAIRFVRPGRSYPNAELLSAADLYPYAVPGLVPLPLRSPRDLLEYRLLRDRTENNWLDWFARAGGVAPEEVPPPDWRMRSHLEAEAATSGQGVLLMSAEVMSYDVSVGRLVQLSDVGINGGSYHLLHGEGVLRRKPAQVFRRWILDETAVWRGQAD